MSAAARFGVLFGAGALGVAAVAVFGWLSWRRSLGATMIAHATVHLTWSALALLA